MLLIDNNYQDEWPDELSIVRGGHPNSELGESPFSIGYVLFIPESYFGNVVLSRKVISEAHVYVVRLESPCLNNIEIYFSGEKQAEHIQNLIQKSHDLPTNLILIATKEILYITSCVAADDDYGLPVCIDTFQLNNSCSRESLLSQCQFGVENKATGILMAPYLRQRLKPFLELHLPNPS